MLFKRKTQHAGLCVLRVSTDVLRIPDVVIADGNAASQFTGFHASPAGLAKIDRDDVFAEWWRHSDQIRHWEHSRVKCAEVLVPDCVPPEHLLGAYVSCDQSAQGLRSELQRSAVTLGIGVDAHLFFQ